VSRVLGIDTANASCSAALWDAGTVTARQAAAPRGHADLLLPMVESLLTEAGFGLAALDAIAFGRGPGSFTGLRIAASVALGLGYGAGRPLAPISDLAALAHQAWRVAGAEQVFATLDARMGEVYCAAYRLDAAGRPALIGVEAVGSPTQVVLPDGQGWFLYGRGAAVAGSALASRFGARLAGSDAEAEPSAEDVAALGAQAVAAGALVAAAEAQPVYLRDRVAEPAP